MLPRLPDITIPALDLEDPNDTRLRLEVLTDYLANLDEFVPKAPLTYAAASAMNSDQVASALRLSADEVIVAPPRQKEAARKSLLDQIKIGAGRILTALVPPGGDIARVMGHVQTATEYVVGNVAMAGATALPGQQGLEKRYEGLQADPDSVYYQGRFGPQKALREAYRQTNAPWGVKFWSEVLLDPTNLIGSWTLKPFVVGERAVLPAARPVGVAFAAGAEEAPKTLAQAAEGLLPVAGGMAKARKARVFKDEVANFPIGRSALSQEQLDTVVAAIPSEAHRATFKFMQLTGMRAEDISRLDKFGLQSLNDPEAAVHLLKPAASPAGNDLTAIRPITSAAKDFLIDYMANVRPRLVAAAGRNPDTVFMTDTGRPLTANYITGGSGHNAKGALAAAAAKAGVDITSSEFRHSFVTAMAKEGVPVSVIQRCTGHRDLENLYSYVHVVQTAGKTHLPAPFLASDLAKVSEPLRRKLDVALEAAGGKAAKVAYTTKAYVRGLKGKAAEDLNRAEGQVLLEIHGTVDASAVPALLSLPLDQQRAFLMFKEAEAGLVAADRFSSQGYLLQAQASALADRLKGNKAATALGTVRGMRERQLVSLRYGSNLFDAAAERWGSAFKALRDLSILDEAGPLKDTSVAGGRLLNSLQESRGRSLQEQRMWAAIAGVKASASDARLKALSQPIDTAALKVGDRLINRILANDHWQVEAVNSEGGVLSSVRLQRVTGVGAMGTKGQGRLAKETQDVTVQELGGFAKIPFLKAVGTVVGRSGRPAWTAERVADALSEAGASPHDVTMTNRDLRRALGMDQKELVAPLKKAGLLVPNGRGGFQFSDDVLKAFDNVPPGKIPTEMGEAAGPGDIPLPPGAVGMDNGGLRIPAPLDLEKWASDSIKDNAAAAYIFRHTPKAARLATQWVLGHNLAAGPIVKLRFAMMQADNQSTRVATDIHYHIDRQMQKAFGYDVAFDGHGGVARGVTLKAETHPAALGLDAAAAERETRRITTILETKRSDLGRYYQLTSDQQQYYDYYHEYLTRLTLMLKRAGYDPDELFKGASNLEPWQAYVPHTKMVVGPTVKLPPRPSLGEKPGHFQPRDFPTMRAGEASGATYQQNPVEALGSLVRDYYGYIADQGVIKVIKKNESQLANIDKIVKTGDAAIAALKAGNEVPRQWMLPLRRYYSSVYDAVVAGKVDDAVRQDLADQVALHRATLKAEEAIPTATFGAIPALGDLKVRASLIPELQMLMTDQPSRAGFVAGVGSLAGTMRLFATGIDIGAPLIHGFTMLGLSTSLLPTVGRQVRAAWPIAVKGMLMSLKDPTYRAAYMSRNIKWIGEAADVANVSFFSDEFGQMVSSAKGLEEAGKQIAATGQQLGVRGLPLRVGGLGMAGLGKLAGWTSESFNAYLDISRLELYKAMRATLPENATGKELAELGTFINASTGTISRAAAGIPARQQQIEAAFLMYAPSLRRATAALMLQVVSGSGIQRKRAATAIVSLAGSALVMAAILHESGNNKDVFWPTSADFMSVRVGGGRIGIGTAYYSTARLFGNLYRQVQNDPEGLGRMSLDDNVLLKWVRTQLAPTTSLLVDGIHGRSFLGDPLRDQDGDWNTENLKWQAARQFLPFWFESLALQPGTRQLGFAEIVGLRTSPLSTQQQLNNLRLIYLQSDTSDPDLVAWRQRQEAAGKPLTVAEAPLVSVRRLAEKYPGTDNFIHPDIVELEEEARLGRLTRGKRLVVDRQEFVDAVAQNRRVVNQKLEGLSREFDRGLMSGREFRDRRDKLEAELRGMGIATAAAYKGVVEDMEEKRADRLLEPEKDFVGDLAYDKYRAEVTANPALHDEDGNFRPDEFRRLQVGFRASVGADVWRYIEQRRQQGRDLPGAARDLEVARTGLQPYWMLHETTWGAGSPIADLIGSYVHASTREAKASLLLQYPGLRPLLKRLDEVRADYRRQHPEVDAWLVRFYDYAPLTPEGEAVHRARVVAAAR